MLQAAFPEQCVPTDGSTLLFLKSGDNPPGGPRRLLFFANELFIFPISLRPIESHSCNTILSLSQSYLGT